MKIKAYRLYNHAIVVQPSSPARARGKQGVGAPNLPAPDGQGWNLLCPLAFQAAWNGGPHPEDIEICLVGSNAEPAFVQSQLGEGLLTFYPGYQFKTEQEYALWLRGPVNAPKDGIAALESIVDASLLACTVTIHWQFTRPHQTIRFAAGEPFATLLHQPKADLDKINVEVMPCEADAAAFERAFVQMTDHPVLHDLVQRLRAAAGEVTLQIGWHASNGQSAATMVGAQPVNAAPDDYLDTIDGRVDMRQFDPAFFRRERLIGTAYEAHLRWYGEISPRIFYVFDSLKLAYLETPKVACTAIRMALAPASGISFDHDEGFEYRLYLHPLWQRVATKLNGAQSGYHRFSFVRNPFDRLVSCYRSKVIYLPSPKKGQPHFHSYFFAIPANISFADFVGRVCQIPDALADAHFKSQYALLYSAGERQVDYLGKFEQLAEAWRPIAQRYQLEPLLEAANVSGDKPGCHSDYRLYYTEPLVQMVYARYRKDVETFGYEEEYEQLLTFVRQQAQNVVPGVREVKM